MSRCVPPAYSYTLEGCLPSWSPRDCITGITAGAYAYAAKWPTSQLFGRTLVAGSDIQEVALTFDDGPNDPYTQQLLDLLDRRQVRATFFLMGSYVRQHPEIARAIQQGGHLLGNHTMTHPSLLWQRPKRIREELAGCNAVIEDATGEVVKWFRPPFGARRPDVLRMCGRTWPHSGDVERNRSRLGCDRL